MPKNCNLKWVPAGFKSVHCPISLDMLFLGKSLLLSIKLMESDEKEMIKPGTALIRLTNLTFC